MTEGIFLRKMREILPHQNLKRMLILLRIKENILLQNFVVNWVLFSEINFMINLSNLDIKYDS